jgi:hypothetical protein
VAEEPLNRPNVIAVVEEVRGEGVPEGVARDALGDAGATRGALHRALQHALVEVVAEERAGAFVDGGATGGEDPVPAPVRRRARDLPREGIGQAHAHARVVVGAVHAAARLEMLE